MNKLARGPRALVHRGVVEAAGLCFDAPLLGAAAARARALAAWQPGDAVFCAPDGSVVVRFRAPRRVACARAPGTPLVAAAGAGPLCAAPVADDERAALDAPPASAVLVRGGAFVVVPLDARAAVDPADWLALEPLAAVPTEALGAPPSPTALQPSARAAGSEDGSVRALFRAAVGEAPAGLAALLTALRASRDARERDPTRPDVGAAPDAADAPADRPAPRRRRRAGALFAVILAAFSALLARVASALDRAAARRRARPRAPYRTPDAPAPSAPSPAVAPPDDLSPPPPRGPGALERFGARMRALAARLLAASRLARVLGRRQAEYVGKMMELFQKGELEEALRHAIPLGGAGGDAGPLLGLPSPRGDLAISPRERAAGGGAFAFGEDLYAQIRTMYREAFTRLDAEGRVEQAAFVLAELLREHEEAVAYLERHGRHRLAAEIAEARGLPPGLVVRQWFLAGEPARAVRVARRTGAFADAVLRVRASDPARADELQTLWARALADAGDYVAAVETAWPVAAARAEAAAWIDLAIARGGVSAAAMLVRKLELDPASFAAVRERALALCDESSAEREPERRALGELLVATARTPATTTLARPLARALLRDAARAGAPAAIALARNLVDAAADAALRADLVLPTAQPLPALALLETPRVWTFDADDAGAMPAWDAARAADGRTIIALGEAGVRVVHRDGRTLFHLDEPAHRVVISEHGDRALALARRGEAWRIARLDLTNRRARVWSEAALDGFARDFDGSIWVVGVGSDVLLLDATAAEGLEALRRFRDLDGRVIDVARTGASCAVLTATPDGAAERWLFALPAWSLRSRITAPLGVQAVGDPRRRAVAADGGAAAVWEQLVVAPSPNDASARPRLVLFDEAISSSTSQLDVGEPGDTASEVAVAGAWAAVATAGARGVRVEVATRKPARVRMQIELARARRVQLRLQPDLLTVADDRGRVLAFDLTTGERVRSIRL